MSCYLSAVRIRQALNSESDSSREWFGIRLQAENKPHCDRELTTHRLVDNVLLMYRYKLDDAECPRVYMQYQTTVESS